MPQHNHVKLNEGWIGRGWGTCMVVISASLLCGNGNRNEYFCDMD